MKSTYRVFPESGYIIETYRGIVCLGDFLESETRRRDDLRCREHFHLVSDLRRANVVLSLEDIATLVGALPRSSISPKKWALVLANGRNYAIASLLKARLEASPMRVECFVGIEPACAWLAGDSNGNAQTGWPVGQSRNLRPEAPRYAHRADSRSVSVSRDCERIMQ